MDFAGRPIASWLRRGRVDWSLAHYSNGQDAEFHDHAQTQVHFLLCGSFVEYWPRGDTYAVVGPFVGVLPGGTPHRNKWGPAGALVLTAHLGPECAIGSWRGWGVSEHIPSPLDLVGTTDDPACVADYLRSVVAAPRTRGVEEATVESLTHPAPRHNRIADFARARGKSASAYSRSIKRAVGLSPNRIRLEGRLARAVEMIVRTAARLAEVAHECGFCDQAHLTRTMRSRIGMTPGTLRRNMQI